MLILLGLNQLENSHWYSKNKLRCLKRSYLIEIIPLRSGTYPSSDRLYIASTFACLFRNRSFRNGIKLDEEF